MRGRFRRRGYRSAALWLLVLALFALRYWGSAPELPPPADLPAGSYPVERVVDGDTLIIAGGTRVRLIGVNSPEFVKPNTPIEPWGKEAGEFTRQFVAGGTVQLTFDRERLDRHGRLLAYVWVGDRMLNEELVEQGLARHEPQYHYSESKKRRFRQAQDRARGARRGIWSGPHNL